jgi:hypothetical protein
MSYSSGLIDEGLVSHDNVIKIVSVFELVQCIKYPIFAVGSYTTHPSNCHQLFCVAGQSLRKIMLTTGGNRACCVLPSRGPSSLVMSSWRQLSLLLLSHSQECPRLAITIETLPTETASSVWECSHPIFHFRL